MAKGIKTITGDWVNSISKLKLGEVVRIPDESYDLCYEFGSLSVKKKIQSTDRKRG